HLDRHGLVTLVFEISRRAALGIVASDAFEGDHRAVLASLQPMHQRYTVNRIAGDGKEVPGGIFYLLRERGGTAADGRQERYLVTFRQWRAGLGKTLVQG